MTDLVFGGIARVWGRVSRRQPPANTGSAGSSTLALRMALAKSAVFEYLLFDSRLARLAISSALSVLAAAAYVMGKSRTAIDLVMTLDRGAFPGPLPAILRRALAPEQPNDAVWRRRVRTRVLARCRNQMTDLAPQPNTARFFAKPEALLGSVVLVLKPATANEKGVVVLLYSYVLPLFGRLFNLQAILRRYHLVIEPSWSGYCNPDVLCYQGFDDPIFVQAYEPRDREFIDGLRSNLISVPTSNNWWVDHRVFTPIAGVTKDIDVIMVAGWATYKRHAQFFNALRTLRRQGRRPRVALVGYSLGLSTADLRAVAMHYGVADQIEWHEGLSQSEVNVLLNRSKVNVIWSRKEGVNRAIIEGMFAGVPSIVRDGFNYGFEYPYINAATGCFAAEAQLPERLTWMMDNHQRFDPRPWVMAHMSCQQSTATLASAIRDHAPEASAAPLAVKVNGLHGMYYWDDADAMRFSDDYSFLRSTVLVRT